ncbi:hypothetical protein Ciccas_004206 [Cichlidogyrus casuarinus]|uniref:Mitochondrial carrier protein n=1 Tax=Cichlidogyrus casuarinus TaxID=1844966 RepID=A0ABD2QC91_9PLAT
MCLRKTGQFHSIFDCARFIHRESGFTGFYRGYFINLIGIIPYAGIELATYERLRNLYVKHYMAPRKPGEPAQFPPFFVSPLIAGFASACGIVVTYPAALMRTKLQSTTYWSRQRKRVTALDLLKTILQKDGFFGLYRGLAVNLAKVLPAGAISFTTYEALRRELGLGPLGSGS